MPAFAAEATTGTLVGSVTTVTGKPVAGARVTAASPSGQAKAVTDPHGAFVLLGLLSDTYTVSAEASGYEPATQQGVNVLPGSETPRACHLEPSLRTIGRVRAASRSFVIGSTSDAFTVTGATATAISPPPATSSGLINYAAGTVQGAIASVPGVELDPFANAILRGSKVQDTVFEYDSVQLPQGLIAEPGGNVVGAQLPTTGIGATNVTLAGFETQGDNALGGVVDQIPSVGTYPARTTLTLSDGIAGAQYQLGSLEILAATPDQRWRYALASTFANDYFAYGDGTTFYPSEAGTFGLALQTRGQYSIEANVHNRLPNGDDISLLGLVGEANYDQYGTPFTGQTWGMLNGESTTFPGQTDPNEPVTFPSRVRGTYDVLKAQWLRTRPHSLTRVQLFQSQYGSTAGGPFWDDDGYPDGAISLASRQGGRETGIGFDVDHPSGSRHHLRYGAQYTSNNSFLDEVVPTADELVTSNPTLFTYLGYLGDTWTNSRLEATLALRSIGTHVVPSNGSIYEVGAIDPHASASYRLGERLALRATYDRTTSPPEPLEADRTDSTNVTPSGKPAPFVPLAPSVGTDLTFSLEGGDRTKFRATYYANLETNCIDVLPFNFRSAVAGGLTPNGVGVPTNIGDLRAHGAELWVQSGGLTFDANYIRAFSSSASQFAYNDLNAPAIAAGHLFPVSYIPEFTASASYELRLAGGRVRVTPSIAYENGYPYGNGTKAWTFASKSNVPIEVLNDNFVNPGANYYFLRDPSKPWNGSSNPYIATLGTPEGSDPNTLRSIPQTLVNLHVEGDVSRRMTVVLDIANLFANASAVANQVNPYLIGPPGYSGGNPLYAAAYEANAGFSEPYVLGNGVPTNDGIHQVIPWSYGRAGYVPQSYPNAQSVHLGIRFRT